MKPMKSIILFFSGALLANTAFTQSLEEAKRLTENEQYEAASSIYSSLIAKEPVNATLYYYFGDNLLLDEKPDSAILIFDKGLAVDAASLLNKIGKAKELLSRTNAAEAKYASELDPASQELKVRASEAEEDVKQAMVLIEDAVKLAPAKNATVFIEAADALIRYKNKNLERAKTLLDKANTIDPKNVEIKLLYGDIYTELNNGTLAAQYYNEALDLNKTSPRAIVSKGRLYKRSTNYDGAAAEFQNAIAIDANYAPAHRELGETYFRQGKLEKAKEEYRTYLSLSRNNCSARIRYGSFLYLSKDYSGAITEMEQVLKACDATSPQPYRIAAIAYYETKEYTKATDAMNKVWTLVREDRRTSKDYEYYGKILIATGKDAEGIENLKEGFAADPSRTDLLSEVANVYYRNKNYTEAIVWFNKKVASGKDVRAADYYTLGMAQYYVNLYTDAAQSFAKVNETSPKYASGYFWRARANAQLDSTSEAGLAKPFYEKYVDLAAVDSASILKYNAGLVEAYTYLASYNYLVAKDNDKALEYLRKKALLNLDPEELKKVQTTIKQIEDKK
ncbi:MAG: hypothetical protein RIQ47_707 [Bacteroidota bacterium]|jgi:tetratricopeptide (TPR) repeat protein